MSDYYDSQRWALSQYARTGSAPSRSDLRAEFGAGRLAEAGWQAARLLLSARGTLPGVDQARQLELVRQSRERAGITGPLTVHSTAEFTGPGERDVEYRNIRTQIRGADTLLYARRHASRVMAAWNAQYDLESQGIDVGLHQTFAFVT